MAGRLPLGIGYALIFIGAVVYQSIHDSPDDQFDRSNAKLKAPLSSWAARVLESNSSRYKATVSQHQRLNVR